MVPGKFPRQEWCAGGRRERLIKCKKRRPSLYPFLLITISKREKDKERSQRLKKRKVPLTAAVTISCLPGGYKDFMRAAWKKVKLEEYQLWRSKKLLQGHSCALILDILGTYGGKKADALIAKLRAEFISAENVRIAHPCKKANLKVRGLKDSEKEVAEVIITAGGCEPKDVRTGVIRVASNGLDTIWVQHPIAAAKKVATKVKIPISWTANDISRSTFFRR